MESDESDDVPLGKRFGGPVGTAQDRKVVMESDSDLDDLPDWVKEHKSPKLPLKFVRPDSDSDAVDLRDSPAGGRI